MADNRGKSTSIDTDATEIKTVPAPALSTLARGDTEHQQTKANLERFERLYGADEGASSSRRRPAKNYGRTTCTTTETTAWGRCLSHKPSSNKP